MEKQVQLGRTRSDHDAHDAPTIDYGPASPYITSSPLFTVAGVVALAFLLTGGQL